MIPVTKPLLRYHGSKWQIAQFVIDNFPQDHHTYCEPFGGGAAVLLRKQPSKVEVYNDLDSEIANLFMVLRDHRDELLEKLFFTPFSRDAYYEAFEKARSPEGIADPVERARVTMTISYQSFTSAGITRDARSGWRFSVKGGWGQSPADYWKLLHERIMPVAERLRGVNVENRPALEVIERCDDPDTLFYCDPPYMEDDRKEGLGAYRHEMSIEDHEKLADALCRVKGKVVVSSYDNSHYRKWFKGWQMLATSCKTEGHNNVTECIWVSPNAQSRQGSLFDFVPKAA